MLSRMTSTASCEERSRSVSSMRRMNWPPVERAKAHGYRAERILPRWMKPVGDGAKRVRVVMTRLFSQTRCHPGLDPGSLALEGVRLFDRQRPRLKAGVTQIGVAPRTARTSAAA